MAISNEYQGKCPYCDFDYDDDGDEVQDNITNGGQFSDVKMMCKNCGEIFVVSYEIFIEFNYSHTKFNVAKKKAHESKLADVNLEKQEALLC